MFPVKDDNPVESTPYLTIFLVLINLIIFIFTIITGTFDQVVREYAMRPAEIISGDNLHTLFTSMFLHGGFLHVIGNVWFLWIFGVNIEDYFGVSKFLLIYFLAGIVASLTHVFIYSNSYIPTIGASGAVAGILGAYIVKYPRARIYTVFLFFIFYLVKIPAIIFLGIWIGVQVLSGTVTIVAGMQVSTAYWAHAGGFVTGAIIVYILDRIKGEVRVEGRGKGIPMRREF